MRTRRVDHQFNLIQQLQPLRLQLVVGDALAQLPLEALLLETDAADMPLAGYQGQPNRPERAAEVFQTLCELRPEPADEIAAHLQCNAQALFAMPD